MVGWFHDEDSNTDGTRNERSDLWAAALMKALVIALIVIAAIIAALVWVAEIFEKSVRPKF